MLAGRQALELKTHSIRRGSGEREGAVQNAAGLADLHVKLASPLGALGPGFIPLKLTCNPELFFYLRAGCFLFFEERAPERPFLSRRGAAEVKSDQSSGGTARSVSWHLPRQ